MKTIGLIAELEGRQPRKDLPLLKQASYKLDKDDVDAVIAYLNSGIDVIDIMGSSQDPLDKTKYIPGGYSIQSDGYWIWRADLTYFVSKYRIQLPDLFIHSVKRGPPLGLNASKIRAKAQEILTVYEANSRGD
ncbi:hypothetical protein GRI89_02880 [Altererythrobacter salegens]|uniref:Uncharacterized protein n=1 Tax=Croceibacterium salegens TaxID=1737568 RepID=A0A6I4SVZ8_9SPHN|nr:hypothetical protein [Croceibacterium salegens]MXO58492.1 hypothetical protein [Croceibacterium salegens]